MLKKFTFGSEAIAYIREELHQGKTLSTYLLNLPLESGQIVAYLPEDTTREMSLMFRIGGRRAGGVTAQGAGGSITSAFVSEYLGREGKQYAVFEDPWACPNDSFLKLPRYRLVSSFFHEQEVYYLLTSQDRDFKKVDLTIGMVDGGYPAIGILTSLPESESGIQDHQIVKRETLEILAMRAEHIIVGAYDSEGELVWSRPGTSPPHQ